MRKKVEKQKKKTAIIEHWKATPVSCKNTLILTKCKGCNLDKAESHEIDSTCTKRSWRSNMLTINPRFIQKIYSQDKSRELCIPFSCFISPYQQTSLLVSGEENTQECQVKDIIIYPIENEIIDHAIESIQVAEKIKKAVIKLKNEKKISFYTDRSFLNPTEEPEKKRMGLGWVAVSRKENKAGRQVLANFHRAIKDWL